MRWDGSTWPPECRRECQPSATSLSSAVCTLFYFGILETTIGTIPYGLCEVDAIELRRGNPLSLTKRLL